MRNASSSTPRLPDLDPDHLDETQLEVQQYLTFLLGDEIFAIGILKIKEILEYSDVTTVPMMPECIRGVINLRGSVVPVLDLATRFRRQRRETTRRTATIIVETENEGQVQVVGIIVDAVNEVLEIPQEDVEPAPSFGTRVRSDFIQGMGKVAGRFVIILDTDRILAAEDLVALASGNPLQVEPA